MKTDRQLVIFCVTYLLPYFSLIHVLCLSRTCMYMYVLVQLHDELSLHSINQHVRLGKKVEL